MTIMEITPQLRALLSAVSVILLYVYICCIMISIRQKKPMRCFLCVLLFGISYFMHQALRVVILFQTNGAFRKEAYFLGVMSARGCLFLSIELLLMGILTLKSLIHWSYSHISPFSVKESLDFLPSGIAIYHDDGSCILVNNCMDLISSYLSGHKVLDGQELYESVSEYGMHVEAQGRRYQFRHRLLDYENETLHELIADDVTELYRSSLELSRENEELSELSRKMTQYGLNIDETVRQREILQAKVNIHDEMNALLLATRNAAGEDTSPENLKQILKTWQNNALLLCKEADRNPKSNTQQDLETMADLIGIELIIEGELTERNSQVLKLFDLATREAMSNAVKHADAKHLNVSIHNHEDRVIVTYTNDGRTPEELVKPVGGLKNLEAILAHENGSLTIGYYPQYILTVSIPTGGRPNGV